MQRENGVISDQPKADFTNDSASRRSLAGQTFDKEMQPIVMVRLTRNSSIYNKKATGGSFRKIKLKLPAAVRASRGGSHEVCS